MAFGLDTITNLLGGKWGEAADSFASGLDFLGSGGGASSGGDSLIGGLFHDSGFMGSLLSAGAGLGKGILELDAQKEQQDQAHQDKQMQYLLELAKLKYGAHGGGGGSSRNKNADLIQALAEGNSEQEGAINSFARNYIGALK